MKNLKAISTMTNVPYSNVVVLGDSFKATSDALKKFEIALGKMNKMFNDYESSIDFTDIKTTKTTNGYTYLTEIFGESLSMYNGLAFGKEIYRVYSPMHDMYFYQFNFLWENQKHFYKYSLAAGNILHLEPINVITAITDALAIELSDITGIHHKIILEFIHQTYTMDHFKNAPLSNPNYSYSIGSGQSNTSSKTPGAVPYETKRLPGMQAKVLCPCGKTCPYKNTEKTVWSLVQHLNDDVKWTRDQIADWMDELHDTGQVNFEFSVDQTEEEKVNDKD